MVLSNNTESRARDAALAKPTEIASCYVLSCVKKYLYFNQRNTTIFPLLKLFSRLRPKDIIEKTEQRLEAPFRRVDHSFPQTLPMINQFPSLFSLLCGPWESTVLLKCHNLSHYIMSCLAPQVLLCALSSVYNKICP
jgi:hypothetical protein